MEYHKIWLADFFHGFSHLNFNFRETSSTFNPENVKYREALGLWAIFPLVLCGLLWFAYMVFFCYRCCHKSQRKQGNAVGVRFASGLFLLCGCGALAAAFYGNAQMHDGVNNFVHAVKDVNKTVKDSLQVLNVLDRIVDRVETKDISALTNAVSGIPNVTIRNQIVSFVKEIGTNVEKAQKGIGSVRDEVIHVDTATVTDQTSEFESYRWLISILVYSIFIAIFVFTFTALLKKSKWMLMVVSMLCIFFMLFIWSLTSAYLALSIAGGDLCVDPNSFVLSRVNGTVESDILEAYIECKDKSQPYQGEILDSQTAVTQAITALNTTINMTLPFNITQKLLKPVQVLRNDLKFAFGNLSSLTSLVGSCSSIHDHYITGVKAICIASLSGAGYMLLFSMLMGLCSALMVFFSAAAWPYFSKRDYYKAERVKVDDNDPFLPDPRFVHNHRFSVDRGRGRCHGYAPVDDTDPFLPGPEPPLYQRDYGSTRLLGSTNNSGGRSSRREPGVGGEGGDLMRIDEPVGESPPPAYHPGHFMQQYSNLAPKPANVAQSSQSPA